MSRLSMSTAPAPVLRPSAWVGCLACYNAGRLNGDWVDAEEAANVTPEDLHDDPEEAAEHEELWVFDTESLPIKGECSPQEATDAGIMLSYLQDDEIAPFLAWFADQNRVIEAGEEPYNDFQDAYQGEWEDFEEFAQHLVDETGMLDGAPEELARYFDMDAYARDLQFDYWTATSPDGVWIFRNC